MVFTSNQINELARNRLVNGCQNVETAKLEIAFWGHSAVDSSHMVIEQGEERLYVGFVCNGKDMTACIRVGQDEPVKLMYDDEDGSGFELAGYLTLPKLFGLLDAIPNLYVYLDSGDNTERAMGLQLLQHYQPTRKSRVIEDITCALRK